MHPGSRFDVLMKAAIPGELAPLESLRNSDDASSVRKDFQG
jgi:hypothetical protein